MRLIRCRKTVIVEYDGEDDLDSTPPHLTLLIAVEGNWATPYKVSLDLESFDILKPFAAFVKASQGDTHGYRDTQQHDC